MNNLKSPIKTNQLNSLQIIVIVIAIIFIGLLIWLVVSIFSMSKQIHNINTEQHQTAGDVKEYLTATYTPEIQAIIEGENSPWIGSPNPQVTIVQFADFACPYCRQTYSALRQISIKYQNSVKIVFRDLPSYDDSIVLSLAAHCANEQDKFWAMHDKLYAQQSTDLTTDANNLLTIAKQIGLDVQELINCIDEKRYLDKIQDSFIDAQSLGATGTPTWFVNGQKIEGVVTLAEWENLLNQLIN